MAKGFVCLAYHSIADTHGDSFTLRPARLKTHLDWLSQHGYLGVSLGQALASKSDTRARARLVALTFDDGYRDFYEAAWPLLKQHGFSATVFVVAGLVGERASWRGASGTALLDWPRLRELSAAGVEVGAHGFTHHALDHLAGPQLQAEMQRSYAALAEQLGAAPAWLAYPFGRWSQAAAEAAERAGFRGAVTARGGRNQAATPPFKLRRTLMFRRDSLPRFRLKLRTGYASWLDWRMDLRRIK
jgi:peptidoglycan/xylan/chitin deacetylase (PgdA/CDA1 family)